LDAGPDHWIVTFPWIGAERASQVYRFAAIIGLSHHLRVFKLVEFGANSRANDRVIVGQQYANRAFHG